MFEQMILNLAAAGAAFETAYWACFIVGGGLLLISTVLGGDSDSDVGLDTSVDADISFDAHGDIGFDVDAGGVDIDTDVDIGGVGDHAEAMHADASSLATWFSMRFLIFFAASFGAIGVAMTYLSDASQNVVLIVSIVTGVVVGQSVHQIFRKLRKSSGNSLVTAKDFVNQLARVTVAIKSKRKGEVAIRVAGGQRYVPAVAKHEDGHFKSGEIVAVVEYSAGLAEVVSREEHEFLNEPKGGQS